MRKTVVVAALLVLSANAWADSGKVEAPKKITLKEVGRAVHVLIDLYTDAIERIEELESENEELRMKVEDLNRKFLLLKVGQELKKAGESGEMRIVRVPSSGVHNRYPWVTFRRDDVTCVLPERTDRGYVYWNVLVTRERDKAFNLARNLARAGLCAVVRKVPRGLYRVVVVPSPGAKETIQKFGLTYFPYVRKLDLTKSSEGVL